MLFIFMYFKHIYSLAMVEYEIIIDTNRTIGERGNHERTEQQQKVYRERERGEGL